MHSPRNVPLSGDAFACSVTKLLEVASWNVTAESGSYLGSAAHRHARIRWFTFARCHFVGITLETDGLPGLRIQ